MPTSAGLLTVWPRAARHPGTSVPRWGSATSSLTGLPGRPAVLVAWCLFKDMPAQSPAYALTAPRRMDDKAGIGHVCPRARMNRMSVRAPDDTPIIVHGDNGAPWQLSHPPGSCSRFGSRGIPRQGLPCSSHLAQDRPDSRPVRCRRLTYHHAGKHCATRSSDPDRTYSHGAVRARRGLPQRGGYRGPVRPVRMRVSGCYRIIGDVTGRIPGRGRIHHDIRR